MRRVAGVWALTLAASAPPAAAQGNDYALMCARTLFNQMNDEAQCEAALPQARALWALREFTELPVPARTAFLHAVALCAWNLEDSVAAASAADGAGQLGADWADYMRLQIGVRFDNDALAVQGFEAVVEAQPQAAAELPIRLVWGVLRAVRDIDPGGAAALRDL